MPEYDVVKLTRADYPLMKGWLAQPHVQEWWGSPEEEIELIEQDLNHGPTDMRIVYHKGVPFAYVQDYPAHHWPLPQYAQYQDQARAIDTFLGEPNMLGQGHAARYLRMRACALLASGYPIVLVDPSPDNTRAIKAYRNAGFKGENITPCEDGDPVLVLEFCPS